MQSPWTISSQSRGSVTVSNPATRAASTYEVGDMSVDSLIDVMVEEFSEGEHEARLYHGTALAQQKAKFMDLAAALDTYRSKFNETHGSDGTVAAAQIVQVAQTAQRGVRSEPGVYNQFPTVIAALQAAASRARNGVMAPDAVIGVVDQMVDHTSTALGQLEERYMPHIRALIQGARGSQILTL